MSETPTVPDSPSRQRLFAHGLFWNSAFQVFMVAVSFGSMLVLVRVIPPAEFGRSTATTEILALINCFNCSFFIAQAVQLREGESPDWAARWRLQRADCFPNELANPDSTC